MSTIFLPPKIDQICHFIQILLGPILNSKQRTPTVFFTWSKKDVTPVC